MATNPLDVAECLTSDDPVVQSDTMALLTSTLTPLLPGAGVSYNPDFPQIDGIIASSSQYTLKLPGGVETPSLSVPGATNILEFLQPVLNIISTALIVLGPVKILIDIIIAIINVFCSFPNPAKMAAAIIQLIAGLVQLATLFPIAAALVLLLELLKTIIMILSAILLIIVPKIELIIQNATTIAGAFSGDDTAAQGAADKICGIVQDILNDLGILAPINSLLSLIAAFAGLASPELCPATDCCSDCPKIVRNPPEGRLKFLSVGEEGRSFSVELIDATYSDNINSSATDLAEVGATIPFFRELEQTIPLLPINSIPPSADEPEGSYVEDISKYIDGFKVMIDRNLGAANISSVAESTQITAVYSVPHGFAKGQEIAFSGSFGGLGTIVSVVNPTTFIADMTAPATSTVTIPVGNLVTYGVYDTASIARGGIESNFNIVLTLPIIPGSTPPSGSNIRYRMIVDENSTKELVMGCRTDIETAIGDFNGATGEVPGNDGNPASPYYGSLKDLLGIEPSELRLDNVDALKSAVQARLNNPLLPPDDIIALVKADSDKIGRFLERTLCVSISATNSIFTASAQALDISSGQKIALTFQPRTIGVDGGKPAMAGMPPTIDVRGIFTTTHGTLSDIQFDIDSGTYTAELTSDSAGTAEIRAYFLTTDVCSSPAQDAPQLGFPPKILEVRFIEGNLRPRRQGRQYLPSAGGRRR